MSVFFLTYIIPFSWSVSRKFSGKAPEHYYIENYISIIETRCWLYAKNAIVSAISTLPFFFLFLASFFHGFPIRSLFHPREREKSSAPHVLRSSHVEENHLAASFPSCEVNFSHILFSRCSYRVSMELRAEQSPSIVLKALKEIWKEKKRRRTHVSRSKELPEELGKQF